MTDEYLYIISFEKAFFFRDKGMLLSYINADIDSNSS